MGQEIEVQVGPVLQDQVVTRVWPQNKSTALAAYPDRFQILYPGLVELIGKILEHELNR